MKWHVYVYPLISLTYGILMLNDISIPRLGKDSGWSYIGLALILFIAIPFMDYYGKKYEKEQKNKDSHSTVQDLNTEAKKEPLDYLCLLLFLSGTLYFVLLIFIPISEIFLFIFIGSILFCDKSLKKFLHPLTKKN